MTVVSAVMRAEISRVRDGLLAWSWNHESWEIRAWCNIIARELGLLSRDPGNVAMRQMTAKNVADLA
jgi:hypothetical protein